MCHFFKQMAGEWDSIWLFHFHLVTLVKQQLNASPLKYWKAFYMGRNDTTKDQRDRMKLWNWYSSDSLHLWINAVRWSGRQTGTGTEVTSTLILICMEERRVGDEGQHKEYRVGEMSGQNVSAWQNKSVCLYPAVVCDRGGRQARWWFWQTDRLLRKLPACHWGLALVGTGDGEEWTRPSLTETSDLKQTMKTRCNMGKLNQRSMISVLVCLTC